MSETTQQNKVLSADVFYKVVNVEKESVKVVKVTSNLKFDATKSHNEIGELIFMALNNPWDNPLGTPEGQKHIREVGSNHTSMSIGDSIVFSDGVQIWVDEEGFSDKEVITLREERILESKSK